MKFVALALLALLTGCIVEVRPLRPVIVLATFHKGDHVAFKRAVAVVYSARSTPQRFDVNKGDTGVVIEVDYFDRAVRYQVKLDKANFVEVLIAPAWENEYRCDLEAVVYPDPALAPKSKE